jgi:hypothetical protein
VDRSQAPGSAGRLPFGLGAPAGPGSGVDRAPGRQVAVEVDAAEGHVGEVDAISDRVGLGELREEAAAQAGGLLVVEVEGVFPERVGDLDGGVACEPSKSKTAPGTAAASPLPPLKSPSRSFSGLPWAGAVTGGCE